MIDPLEMQWRPNRAMRRAGMRDPGTPPLLITIAKIDPAARTIEWEQIRMSPGAVVLLTGKQRLQQAVIGYEGGVDIMVIGDKTPQRPLAEVEATWTMRDHNGGLGPICHGVGLVVGYLNVAKKATSLPVPLQWVIDRIEWAPSPEQEEGH